MTGELKRTLLPSQDSIEAFCWDFQQWLGPDVSPRTAFASELLLREALVNAAEHGCDRSANAQIHCVVRGRKSGLLIAVTDNGPGFDWRQRWDAQVPEDAISGRGILIYRTYARRVRFNRAGNAVFLTMSIDNGKPSGSDPVRSISSNEGQ